MQAVKNKKERQKSDLRRESNRGHKRMNVEGLPATFAQQRDGRSTISTAFMFLGKRVATVTAIVDRVGNI